MEPENESQQEPEAPASFFTNKEADTDIAASDETPVAEAKPELADDAVKPDAEEVKDQAYWQSQHDRLRAEYDAKAPLLEKVERYEPLFEWLEDPDKMQAIEAVLRGGQSADNQRDGYGQPVPATPQASPSANGEDPYQILSAEIPEAPEMPDDLYDEEAKKAYAKGDKAFKDAIRKREWARGEIFRREQAQAESQRQQQALLSQASKYVQKELGAPADEAESYLADLQNPQKRSEIEKLLFAAWKSSKAPAATPAAPPPPTQPRVDPARLDSFQRGAPPLPTPGATVPGSTEEKKPSFFQYRER